MRDIGVGFVTVTMNAISPEVASNIYEYVEFNKTIFTGVEAGKVIIEQQLHGLRLLNELGIESKINSVAIKSINEHEIPEISKTVAKFGCMFGNIIPLIPVEGTAFSKHPVISHSELSQLKNESKQYLKQIHHCQRCRADAAGCLNI
jgi:nitrogen fixation protein NifB